MRNSALAVLFHFQLAFQYFYWKQVDWNDLSELLSRCCFRICSGRVSSEFAEDYDLVGFVEVGVPYVLIHPNIESQKSKRLLKKDFNFVCYQFSINKKKDFQKPQSLNSNKWLVDPNNTNEKKKTYHYSKTIQWQLNELNDFYELVLAVLFILEFVEKNIP